MICFEHMYILKPRNIYFENILFEPREQILNIHELFLKNIRTLFYIELLVCFSPGTFFLHANIFKLMNNYFEPYAHFLKLVNN